MGSFEENSIPWSGDLKAHCISQERRPTPVYTIEMNKIRESLNIQMEKQKTKNDEFIKKFKDIEKKIDEMNEKKSTIKKRELNNK